MTKTTHSMYGNVGSTLLLIFTLIAVSLAVILKIKTIVEKDCLQTLDDTVEQGAAYVYTVLGNAERRMDVVANTLADYAELDAETCRQYLNGLSDGNLISSYSVLLPDGQMVYDRNADFQVTPLPDFMEESTKLARFVSRYQGITDEEYAAYVSPILKDGHTVGILYGYVRLSDLPEKISYKAFDGKGHLYLVDGSTGDFLMDTWHNSLDNMYDEYFSHRKTKLGTSFTQMRENVANEQSGYVVFESRTVGEDFYSYYYPVGKYHLSFQVTVARPIAFEKAIVIQRIVLILAAVQFTVVLVYVLAMFRKAKRRNQQAKKELALNRVMNDIQQTLFSVYKKPYLIGVSLKMLEEAITSEQIMLMLLNDGRVEEFFGLPAPDDQEKERVIGKQIPEAVLQDIDDRLGELGVILSADTDQEILRHAKGMPGMQRSETVRNLVAVWVLNSNQEIIGLMYAVNVSDPKSSFDALSTVANSFQLAVQTLSSYNLLYQMGELDAMTGLKNRNAYQKDLENYEKRNKKDLCCIYVDVNGLHDMNNNFGHASGDKMLRCVGEMVRELFGFEGSYRTGGDEFVVLCTDLDEGMVRERLQILQTNLEKQEYFVSVGFAFLESGKRLQQMIETAESRMYEAKKAFYAGNRDRRKPRQRNQELEAVLMEKRDQENFLSAISANYLGVYAVNLDTDLTRTIYKPSYFEVLLKDTGYCFQSAIREYAHRFVAEGDYEMFVRFLDYSQIQQDIGKGHILECCYRKKNGDSVRVRVLPMEQYSVTQKDTLWIFEKYVVAEGILSGKSRMDVKIH